ncbi:MAG TPA: hypothetical protein VJU78_17440, partial [Chitinophagaceae bacterium]|nr:hypothetical protein [Chitinophagaceae bacterium]
MKNSIKALAATTLLTILFSYYSTAQEMSASATGTKNHAPGGMVSAVNKSDVNGSSIILPGTITATNPELITKFSA